MTMIDETPPLPAALAREIDSHAEGFSGILSMWVHDLGRRETYGLRASEPFDAASTIKLFILEQLFHLAEQRELRLDESVEVRREDLLEGSGVLKDLSPGLRITLKDAAVLMITVSDNVAANLLMERMGVDRINQMIVAGGYRDTRLAGKFSPAQSGSSTSTARELGQLMTSIARQEAVSAGASRMMLGILRREQNDTIVGRLLPYEPQDLEAKWRHRPVWWVASKSGSLRGGRHDVAYVDGKGLRYVVSLMSRDSKDVRFTVDNEATLCLARIARAIHDYVMRPEGYGSIRRLWTLGRGLHVPRERGGLGY